MRITYTEYKKIIAEGINNFPMFFAFNTTQFEEGKQKIGVTDNKDLLSIGMGGYIRKSDKELFTHILKKRKNSMKEFLKDNTNLKEAFYYELNNHEYYITRDISDTMSSLELEYEKLSIEQKDILQQTINEYLAACNEVN